MISSGPLELERCPKPCLVLLRCSAKCGLSVAFPWPSSNHRRCKNRVELFGCVAESGRGAVTPAVCLHVACLLRS
jgi:hypothetical protein